MSIFNFLDKDLILWLDLWMIIPLFLMGSILHFVYNWTKHNKSILLIAAANESYWEHIKIAFWPIFLLYLIEFIFGGWSINSFLPSRAIALYSIPVLIISLVFIYKYFTKRNIPWLDIIIFFLSLFLAQIISDLILYELDSSNITNWLSGLFIVFIVIGFSAFTYKPPQEPDLFKDPITNKYGVKGHK